MSHHKLPRAFYLGKDVVTIARDLIGMVLCTRIRGSMTSGIITETEAYRGVMDRASHAWNGRRTARNEVMYRDGGFAYIYLCYGIHHLFNVVTDHQGVPHAVLIRSIHPMEGKDRMRIRRGRRTLTTNGPGTLSQALGIRTTLNGTDLLGEKIWIENRGIALSRSRIAAGPRIGVDYAGDDALLPYRFRLTGDLVHSLS